MSLLDTIKGLLCKLMADKPAAEQENKAPEAPGVTTIRSAETST